MFKHVIFLTVILLFTHNFINTSDLERISPIQQETDEESEQIMQIYQSLNSGVPYHPISFLNIMMNPDGQYLTKLQSRQNDIEEQLKQKEEISQLSRGAAAMLENPKLPITLLLAADHVQRKIIEKRSLPQEIIKETPEHLPLFFKLAASFSAYDSAR